MHTVVGFLSYRDFVDETLYNIATVRVQDFFQVSTANGMEWVTHYVEIAGRQLPPRDEMYVCRFRIGGGLMLDRERRRRDAENARRAVEILRQDLEQKGFRVRPGLFAATKDSDVLCGDPPWHFEQDETGMPILVSDLEASK